MSTTIWVRSNGAGNFSGDSLANAKTLAQAIDYLNIQSALTDELIFNIYAPLGATTIVLTSPLSAMVTNGTNLGRVWWRGVDATGADAEAVITPSTSQSLHVWTTSGQCRNHVWSNINVFGSVNATPSDNAPWLFRNGTINCLWFNCIAFDSPVGWNLGYGSNINVSGTLVGCAANSMTLTTVACANVCEVSAIECQADGSAIGFLNIFFMDRSFVFGCPTSFKGCRVMTSCTSDTGQTAAYHASSTAMQFVLDGIATQTPIGLLGDTGNNEQVPVTLRRFGEYAVTTRISQPDGGYLSDNSGATATNSPFEDIGGFDYDLNNDPAGGGTMYGLGVPIGDGSVSYHDSGISQHPCPAGNATTVFTGTVLNRGVN